MTVIDCLCKPRYEDVRVLPLSQNGATLCDVGQLVNIGNGALVQVVQKCGFEVVLIIKVQTGHSVQAYRKVFERLLFLLFQDFLGEKLWHFVKDLRDFHNRVSGEDAARWVCVEVWVDVAVVES